MVLIPVFTSISIILATIWIYWYIRHHEALEKRFERIEGRSEFREGKGELIRKQLLKFFVSFSQLVAPKNEEKLSQIRMILVKAGYHRPQVLTFFYGGKTILAILLFTFFIFARLTFIKELPYTQTILYSIFLAALGFFLPDLWLRLKTSRRKEDILKAFPDTLDLLVTCVEAGLGLDAAINRVAEEVAMSSPVLSEELKLMAFERSIGKPREDALKALAMRTDLEEVSSLVTLLIQTERFGTSIAQALRVHSDAMRTRRRQKAEELAAKMSVKMVIPLILFILPAVMLVVVGPGIIRIARLLLSMLGGR